MNCDCPRSTGIIHYEECPMHDSHSCAVCETENHGNKLIAKQARAEVLAACTKHECYGCKSGWLVWKEGNSWWHPFDKTRGAGVAEDCKASWLRDLQPAASDLEELLEQANRSYNHNIRAWYTPPTLPPAPV